jgi:hypothetical protein
MRVNVVSCRPKRASMHAWAGVVTSQGELLLLLLLLMLLMSVPGGGAGGEGMVVVRAPKWDISSGSDTHRTCAILSAYFLSTSTAITSTNNPKHQQPHNTTTPNGSRDGAASGPGPGGGRPPG